MKSRKTKLILAIILACVTVSSLSGMAPGFLTAKAAEPIACPEINAGTTPMSYLIGRDGTVYVAFKDPTASNKITVLMKDGESWNVVGNRGFANIGTTIRLFEYRGNPCVASVSTVSGKTYISLSTFNGSTWSTGTSLNLNSNPGCMHYGVEDDGEFYAAWYDGSTAQIRKWNGSSWASPFPSISSVDNKMMAFSFAVDSSGTPYLLRRHSGVPYYLTLYKYNGTGWVTVGPTNFVAALDLKLLIGNGSIYVLINTNESPYVVKGFHYNESENTWDELPQGITEGYYLMNAFMYRGTPIISTRINGTYNHYFIFNGSEWDAFGEEYVSSTNMPINVFNKSEVYISYIDTASGHLNINHMPNLVPDAADSLPDYPDVYIIDDENDKAYIYGTVDASIISAEVTLSTCFHISPNAAEPDRFTSPDMTIKNTSTMPIYVDAVSMQATGDAPKIVAHDKYSDEEWNLLGIADTAANIALGLTGVPEGDFFFAGEDSQTAVHVDTNLLSQASDVLGLKAKFGLSWPIPRTFEYALVFAIGLRG